MSVGDAAPEVILRPVCTPPSPGQSTPHACAHAPSHLVWRGWDQAHSPMQARHQWRRSRSGPNPQEQPKRPSIPVSAATRNKLQAFHFQPLESESVSGFSDGPARSARVANAAVSAPGAAYMDKENKPFAPAGIDADDGRDAEDAGCASERILWTNPGPHQQHLPDLSLTEKSRRRKRARSSSPCSSSPVPNRQPATPSLHAATLAQATLRTPNAGPAGELWNRFSLVTASHETSPTGSTNPLLAHLLASSSPRPSRKDSDMRPGPNDLKSFAEGYQLRRSLAQAEEDGSSARLAGRQTRCGRLMGRPGPPHQVLDGFGSLADGRWRDTQVHDCRGPASCRPLSITPLASQFPTQGNHCRTVFRHVGVWELRH